MGLDAHPAGPLAKATSAPSSGAMADGQQTGEAGVGRSLIEAAPTWYHRHSPARQVC
jgi:hypothetical protein